MSDVALRLFLLLRNTFAGRLLFYNSICYSLQNYFKSQEILTAKSAKGLCKERNILSLRNLIFATLAKNLCVSAVKRLLQFSYATHNLWYLCKNNFDKQSLCHCVCLLAGGDKKGAVAGKGIFEIETPIYLTLPSSTKGCDYRTYIVRMAIYGTYPILKCESMKNKHTE